MLAIVVPDHPGHPGLRLVVSGLEHAARYRPDWAYSGRIELVVWSIPALTVIFLGGVAWIGSHDLDPASRSPSAAHRIEVQVVSLDWKWLFIYPDQGDGQRQPAGRARGHAGAFRS